MNTVDNIIGTEPPPTLYHIPKTISSPIVQCLIELGLVRIGGHSSCMTKKKDNDDKDNDDSNVMIHVQEMTFAELKTFQYLNDVNPMGTSPAFCDPTLKMNMWESGAILDHILERYDTQYQLHPPSKPPTPTPTSAAASTSTPTTNLTLLRKRAKYLQIKQYIIATVYPFLSSLYLHTLKPIDEQDMVYVRTSKEKWYELLGPILTKWLVENDDANDDAADRQQDTHRPKYLLGNEISAVDYLITKPLNNAYALGILSDEKDKFPELHDLYQRIRSQPSFALAYESQQQQQSEHEKTTCPSANAAVTGTSTSSSEQKQPQNERSSTVITTTRVFALTQVQTIQEQE